MIPDFIKPYLAVAAAILLTVVATYATYIYKDRQRLQAEMGRIEDQIERNKKTAESLLDAANVQNKQQKERYDADAKQKDADYAKLLARLNSRGPVGVREFAGCGNGSSTTGQAGKDSTGTPEKPAAESGAGSEVRELVLTEAAVGQVLQWYAYGQSCHAFVNQK